MYSRSLNLQDMCLIAVVRDIDFFVYNKTIPQKHIDFLFRVYSDDVLPKLEALKKRIDEECMLWLLHPHVKNVCVPLEFQSERVMEKLRMVGFGITSLNLQFSGTMLSSYPRYYHVQENVLNSTVCCLPHVVHLNLSDTSCSDETLTCIQKSCLVLQTLNVKNCYKITNHGMKNVCRGQLLLKNLNVNGTKVNDVGIFTVLDKMPSLECLEYDKLAALLYKIGNKKQYNLLELMYYNYFTGEEDTDLKIIQAVLDMCPKLKKLHFKERVSQHVLNICASFQNLEELKIKNSHNDGLKISDIVTPILPIAENLKTLILSCASISIVTLVECFKSLEALYLKKVSFTPFEKEDIHVSKTNLFTLVMKDIAMEGATYEGVTSLISLSKNVSKLYLKRIKQFPPEIFDIILKSMKDLSLVNFDFTVVDMQYVNPFFEIPSMSTIVVGKKTFTGELFGKNTSCTLSWRNPRDFGNKFHYFRDESDVISDLCDCYDDEDDYTLSSRDADFYYSSD